MKNLGEKLQEARNAMGLSVKDVAEATRLRADVIVNMESGVFDFKLPEIYKRGFLRIYAAFLKLDVDNALEQYALISKPSDESRKSILSRKFPAREAAETQQAAFVNAASAEIPVSVESRYDESDERKGSSDETAKYIKLGGIVVALLLSVIIIILVISSFTSSAPEPNPDLAQSNDVSAPVGQKSAEDARAAEFDVVIAASADTYLLVYPQGEKANILYTGSLQAGEMKDFKTSKPLTIRITDAEKIRILRNGKQLDLKGAKGLCLFNVTAK